MPFAKITPVDLTVGRRFCLRLSELKVRAFWIRTRHLEDLKVTVHQKESSLSSGKLNLGILQQPLLEVAAGWVCLSESTHVCVCSSQGSGDWGEAQVFVYTHTTISGHSRVPLLGQAERSEQATGLCVQKLLTVLTLVQVSCCHCTNTTKQAADRFSRYESPQGTQNQTCCFNGAVDPVQKTI